MGAVYNDASAVIANAQSLSAAICVGAGLPVAILMPAAWTAAVLTFQGSVDSATYGNIYDDGGTEYSVTVDVSRHVTLDPAQFLGAQFLKVRSGTAGTPVTQGAERTLTVITRRDANS